MIWENSIDIYNLAILELMFIGLNCHRLEADPLQQRRAP